jgi:hypothetical protein
MHRFKNNFFKTNTPLVLNNKRYSLGVTSLAFDTAGTILAIGTSYNYERGNMVDVKDRDQIYIRKVSELETKPK